MKSMLFKPDAKTIDRVLNRERKSAGNHRRKIEAVYIGKEKFINIQEASNRTGISPTHIQARINNENDLEVRADYIERIGRRVSIEGTIYAGVKEAASALGVKWTVIRNRANSTSGSFDDWFFIDD